MWFHDSKIFWIKSFINDENDSELEKLVIKLETLIDVSDIRPILGKDTVKGLNAFFNDSFFKY